MGEETSGKSQNEMGKKKMGEETEEQSQNSESIQCVFCGQMVSSSELYEIHVEMDHPNATLAKNLNFQMEGGNLDMGKKEMEEESVGESHIDKGKRKMEEETTGQSKIEKGKKKMEDKTEQQSQAPGIQCFFCDHMVSSYKFYELHLALDHKDIVPWERTGQIVSDKDLFPCAFCPVDSKSRTKYVEHLHKAHQSESLEERRKRGELIGSDSESVGIIGEAKQDTQSDASDEAWKSYINDQENNVADKTDDQEKGAADKVDDQENSDADPAVNMDEE